MRPSVRGGPPSYRFDRENAGSGSMPDHVGQAFRGTKERIESVESGQNGRRRAALSPSAALPMTARLASTPPPGPRGCPSPPRPWPRHLDRSFAVDAPTVQSAPQAPPPFLGQGSFGPFRVRSPCHRASRKRNPVPFPPGRDGLSAPSLILPPTPASASPLLAHRVVTKAGIGRLDGFDVPTIRRLGIKCRQIK